MFGLGMMEIIIIGIVGVVLLGGIITAVVVAIGVGASVGNDARKPPRG